MTSLCYLHYRHQAQQMKSSMIEASTLKYKLTQQSLTKVCDKTTRHLPTRSYKRILCSQQCLQAVALSLRYKNRTQAGSIIRLIRALLMQSGILRFAPRSLNQSPFGRRVEVGLRLPDAKKIQLLSFKDGCLRVNL